MHRLVEKWHYNAESPDCIPIKASQKILDWRQYNLSSLDQILQREGPEGRLFLRCPQCGLECANKTVLGSHMAKAHPQQTRPTFNRLLHSVGGRPRCSGCNDPFSSWDRLRKHIGHGACQFPVSETGARQQDGEMSSDVQPGADKTEDASLPTALNPEVHNIIRHGGWRSLVQNVQWRKQLAQWCCLCGTWCASNRAVKMHLAKTHKAVWNLHKDRIERICRSQQADITIPCSLCGSISKDPKSHVVACPVIFQSVLIDFQQNGGSSGSGFLHASVAAGQSITTERSNGGSDELGGGKQTAPERPRATDRGRTARQRMAQDKARKGAGALRSAFAAGHSRCPETGRSNGQVGFTVVGCEPDAPAGLRLSLVRQQGGGRDPAGYVRDQCGVETSEGNHFGEGDPTVVLHHDGMHTEGARCQNPTGGPGREPPESCQVSNVDQFRKGLAVQEMGSSEQGPDQHGQDATDHDGATADCRDTPSGCQDSGRPEEVSSVAAVDAGSSKPGHGPGGLLQYTGGSAGRSWPANASQPRQAVRQHGAEASEKPHAAGTQSAQRHGKSGGSDAIWVATRLKLLNSGNTCYINSFVHAVSWMLETTGGQVSRMGRGANAWRTIMSQAKSFAVTQLFTWSALQQGWRHGGRQHDVCEYTMYMLGQCQDTPFHGIWEARVMEQRGVRTMDHGACASAITIEPSLEGHWVLQDAVDNWRSQAFTHALVSCPSWLLLRVNRFHQDASGVVSKIRAAMRWADRIRMPIFSHADVSFHEVHYTLRSCIVHLGESAHTGHYRALLMPHGDESNLRYCDDGSMAKVLRNFDSVAEDIYLLFLVSLFLWRIIYGLEKRNQIPINWKNDCNTFQHHNHVNTKTPFPSFIGNPIQNMYICIQCTHARAGTLLFSGTGARSPG